MDEKQISVIVQKVLNELGKNGEKKSDVPCNTCQSGVFDRIEDAIEAAYQAQLQLVNQTIEKRKEIIEAIRRVGQDNAVEFARRTIDETRMGRYEHKVLKCQLASKHTLGVEDLETIAWSGDHGLTIEELAPFGVIGAILPSTHPVPTMINNSISMISAGNSVVVNAHPGAKNVSNFAVQLLNQGIIAAGGPANLIACAKSPTMETGQVLFTHPKIAILTITGGPGVVKAAMKAGKRAICAGPGNPPVVVDETADLANAAKCIVAGATFDNNLLCIGEKIIIAVESIADELKRQLTAHNSFEISTKQMDDLANIVFKNGGWGEEEPFLNREWVGKDAQTLAQALGISVPPDTEMLFGETPDDHPFVNGEQMMCCLPFLRSPNVDAAILLAQKVEHSFRHSAMMHSKNVENMTKMGKIMNCTLFVKNGPSSAGLGIGGEGYFTHSIASPTGEGITSTRTFTRRRRCAMVDYLNIL
ncbi:aldehyde dehydrogenase EutE [candidate division KSB1 bacterium]|nr:aldehyde dehydrogenase EutE [candidate division KSB1 bacterium]